MKRLFDFIFSLISILAVFPILFLTMLIIIVLDQQNPIFLQKRLGLNKEPFTIFKLRTMKNEKITFFGKILRKTGIDELPQLLNILTGKMSFIGPRPLTLQDIDRLNWNTPFHKIRWNVRPGIAGLAQLSPICHRKMSWYLDLYYVQQHTLILDFKLLLSSFSIIFIGKSRIQKRFYKTK